MYNVDQESVNNFVVKRFTNGRVRDKFRPTNRGANMTHGTPLKSACVRLLGHVYGESGKALLNDIYIMELSALCHGKA